MRLLAGAVLTALAVLSALDASAQAAGDRAAQDGIDHTVYRAGQHLRLELSDDEDAGCTAAFSVRIGRRIYGLTAGHCAVRGVGTRVFRERPGTELGTVQRALSSRNLDAVAFSRDTGFTHAPRWAQEIERGSREPLRVTGFLPTSEQRWGVRVCFAGRTTGADQCGPLSGGPGGPSLNDDNTLCALITGHPGDSGGPVYTEPVHGYTRAVGIVSTIETRVIGTHFTCYTPIQEILNALGGLDRLPQPGEIR
jgi:hypothetical protein